MVRATVFFDVYLVWLKNSFVGKLVYANAARLPTIFLSDVQANEDLTNTVGGAFRQTNYTHAP